MAFVRYKVVKGKKYYQWVRNYRENGKHKQEVLYHLGPDIPSPEAAIAAEKKELARWRRREAKAERERDGLFETIKDDLRYLTRLHGVYTDQDWDDVFYDFLYDQFFYDINVQDRIEFLEAYRAFFMDRKDRPSSFYAWGRKKNKWAYMWDWDNPSYSYYRGLDELHQIYESGEYNIWEEECQMEIRLYKQIERFRELSTRLWEAEERGDDHESNLSVLQRLRKEYT